MPFWSFLILMDTEQIALWLNDCSDELTLYRDQSRVLYVFSVSFVSWNFIIP